MSIHRTHLRTYGSPMVSNGTAEFVPALTGVARDSEVVAVKRRSLWAVIAGALGGVAGLAPHVLHHIGPLVGTFLVAGAGGTALFGFLGLAASVPVLIRLRVGFSTWWAPAIALGLFSAAFLVSTFVLGPLISSGPDGPTGNVTDVDHAAHHDG